MKRSAPSSDSSPSSSHSSRPCRLLLHSVDGCVPFLTPSVLEKYFPPSNDFWIGMAVRDICVSPVYKTNVDSGSNEKKNSKKPRGYTFVGVPPDSWLEPYTRVTVPSFNLLEDTKKHSKAKAGKANNNNNSSSNKNNNNTNNHVFVWTPHGRQKMTPEQYATASEGLRSEFTLSLYDMPNDDDTKKRIEKVEQRNKTWFQDLQTRRDKQPNASPKLWSPILLPLEGKESSDSLLQVAHANTEDVAGVALVGKWRRNLETMLQETIKVPNVAILSTESFAEVLEILDSDVIDIIGSDLPTRWAKDKAALCVKLADIDDTKRQKKENESSDPLALNEDGCIDLHDKKYERDSRPLLPGCSCLSCKSNKFSRSYIHHLVQAKEILAEVLIFGHNLHHLLSIIRAFNQAKNRESLRSHLENQLQKGN